MSWQATAWAVRQKTGAAGCKLLLLTLANYADADGCCWPSQEVLSEDTEQSVDTVQRQLRKLQKTGLIRSVPRPLGPGRWPGRTYFLSMPVAEISKPQSAARSDGEQPAAELTHPTGKPIRSERTCGAATGPQDERDYAAPAPGTMPHQARDCAALVRHEPSINLHLEPSLEPSSSSSTQSSVPRPNSVERQKAFREGRKGVEVIQNRIAQKVGFDGWEILQSLSEAELHRVTALEERGRLDVDAIELLRLTATSLRKERQLEGSAKAKSAGVCKSSKPTVDIVRVRALKHQQGVGPSAVAKTLGIGVYRALGEQGGEVDRECFPSKG